MFCTQLSVHPVVPSLSTTPAQLSSVSCTSSIHQVFQTWASCPGSQWSSREETRGLTDRGLRGRWLDHFPLFGTCSSPTSKIWGPPPPLLVIDCQLLSRLRGWRFPASFPGSSPWGLGHRNWGGTPQPEQLACGKSLSLDLLSGDLLCWKLPWSHCWLLLRARSTEKHRCGLQACLDFSKIFENSGERHDTFHLWEEGYSTVVVFLCFEESSLPRSFY